MARPHHGNWHNVEEEPEIDLSVWYPACAFDDPEDPDPDPPEDD
jgi:hypothetical protein